MHCTHLASSINQCSVARALYIVCVYVTDQPEEGDSLLEEEEQRITDQLAEEELIVVDEKQGEFVISVFGEVNM